MGYTVYKSENYLTYMGTYDPVNMALLMDESAQTLMEQEDAKNPEDYSYEELHSTDIEDDENYESIEDSIEYIDFCNCDSSDPTDYLDSEVDEYIDPEVLDFDDEIDAILGIDD